MSSIIQQSEIVIDAPIAEVWKLFAEEFAEIDKWSSSVSASQSAGNPINTLDYSERACEISAAGFNDTKERILTYDEPHQLTYSLYDGLPGFVKNAENTWTFEEQAGKTKVVGQTEMEVSGILGFIMGGFMKRSLKSALDQMTREAKYFIENGRPHPDKVKAMEKLAKKQARLAPA
ncbi:MAG: SRPBCC family protein [Chloroflexota bacterium]